MDPSLLHENLRRNRLERTRLRQLQLLRGNLHKTPGASTESIEQEGFCAPDESLGAAAPTEGIGDEGIHQGDGIGADESLGATVHTTWGVEFAARQVQRRAGQVCLPGRLHAYICES